MKNVDALLDQAEKLVLAEIEKRVTKILLNPKNRAVSFVMAMGGYCFYSENDSLDDCAYMGPVVKLFDQYDEVFKLSGIGWRWDLVNGEVVKITDW